MDGFFNAIDNVTVTGGSGSFTVTLGGTQSTTNMFQIFGNAANASNGSTLRTINTAYDAASQIRSVSDPSSTINLKRDNVGRAITRSAVSPLPGINELLWMTMLRENGLKVTRTMRNRDYKYSMLAMALLFVMLQAANVASGDKKSFGDRQVEQLLDDRPDLKTVLVPESPIYEWIVNAFDGNFIGQRIYWNSSESPKEPPSFCLAPQGSYPGHIRVTANANFTPYDRLALVVFELHNLEAAVHFVELRRVVKAGKVGRDEFADKMVEVSLQTRKKVVEFFQTNPVPEGHGRQFERLTSKLPSFEEYKAKFESAGERNKNSKSKFDHYRKVWDKLVQGR